MTFPFSNDKNVRKYCCFVCGRAYTEFEEYKTHITESHDEGREYIICPLERCGAPVRDIKLHFAAKHPYETVPKKGQMKALVWKDQNPNGKLKKRKSKFREGYLISNKNGGKEMHYRSSWECDVYEYLEFIPEVLSYEVEPFKVKYSFKGESHEYNPDLKINFDDGHIEIWEIKPMNQTHLPINTAKWAACQQHCQTRGFKFMVLTEVGIDKLKQRIKNINENLEYPESSG